jgi:membrane protein implicated in regulation of membrane protease activity
MLERLILVIAFYLAFFKVPILLKQWMPSMFAYGLPILLFVALYALALIWARRFARKGEPNNSLNRSASELGFYRQLESIGGSSRPVNSGVRFLLNDLGQRHTLAFTSREH